MPTNLTELTGRYIRAEAAIVAAGHFDEASSCRKRFNDAPTRRLETAVRLAESAAYSLAERPKRFVLPAGEPVEWGPGDALALSPAAIAGCRVNRGWLDCEERRRRGVD